MSFFHKKHSIMGLLSLFNALQSRRINPEEILFKHGIELDTLSASTLLNVESELLIVQDALALTDDPLFGLNVGNQITITSYGLFALLLLSAPTFKDVIDMTVRYQRLSLSFSEVSVFYGQGFVEVRNHLPDVSQPLRHFIADRDFSGNAVFIREIQGDTPNLLMGLRDGKAAACPPSPETLQAFTECHARI